MKNPQVKNALRFMQWVALTFVLVLGALATHDATRATRTLDASRLRLDEWKLKDMDDPGLAKTVRELDHVYRATYFQTHDRRAYAFLLLGVGFCVLCGLLVLEHFLFPPDLQIPERKSPPPGRERRETLVFAACGVFLLCGILFALRLTRPPVASTTNGANDTIFNATGDEKSNENETSNIETVTKTAPSALIERPKILLAEALEEESLQWAQFRGGVLPNRNTLPKNWDFTEKWRVNIPLPGFNSPLAWDDNLFLAGGDKTERAVFCFSATDGTQRWKVACTEAAKYPKVDDQTGVSAPTLCVDKQRVYGIFATGEMVCCTHDGEIVWKKQLPTPDILYGYASSPLLLGDRLIVQYDLHDTQTVYALDVYTGDILWETKRETECSWSSPTALVRDGKAVIFVAGNAIAQALDAETGDVIWTHKGMGGEVAASAFVSGNAFYFSNQGAFTGAFAADDGTILCKNDNVPAPDVASSVLFGDVFLLFTSYGTVIAIDAKTAEELHEHDFDNGFYASPVIVQNKIVAVNLDGELLLLTATKEELTVAGRYALETEVAAIPAFHRGNIIVRTSAGDLICLEEKGGEAE